MELLILKSIVLIAALTWTLSIVMNALQGRSISAPIMWTNGIAWGIFYFLSNL